MEKELFGELVQSLKQAAAISKGKSSASRRFHRPSPDARAVRESTGLSQAEFAGLMHVSVRTLQNWEQGRRMPTGPAVALLKIVANIPEAAIKTLNR